MNGEPDLDLLYILKYPAEKLASASQRLRCSLSSIKNQGVRIVIVNFSEEHISSAISQLRWITYHHCPVYTNFSRAKAINYATKRFVETVYFAVSDIDLVYQRHHFALCRRYLKEVVALPVRIITYNYNVLPRVPRPYTASVFALKRLPRSLGGYAHGNGIIHLPSFQLIQGYDEYLVGYGPEDDLFNCRIGRINKLVFLPDSRLTTYHLWHEVSSFDEERHRRNMEYWREQKTRIWGLREEDKNGVIANQDSTWGDFCE